MTDLEFDLSQDELKPFSGEQSVRSVVDVAGPALRTGEDGEVFFNLFWLKTHLNLFEKQSKDQCKWRKALNMHLFLPNPLQFYSFAQDICVCGGEQDFSGKYLQWFTRLCAQDVLF